MHDPHDEREHDHGADHGHHHGPFQKDHDTGPAGAYEVLEEAIRSLLIEKGVLTAQEIAAQVDLMDSRTPARGAKVVARAWVDPGFKRRLLKDTRAPLSEFGIDIGTLAEFCTVENTTSKPASRQPTARQRQRPQAHQRRPANREGPAARVRSRDDPSACSPSSDRGSGGFRLSGIGAGARRSWTWPSPFGAAGGGAPASLSARKSQPRGTHQANADGPPKR